MKHLFLALSTLALASGSSTAGPCVLQVPADFPSIQQAIDAAAPGCTILVAPGTYSGPGNRDLDFGGKAITLQSTAGAAATILDGQDSFRLINLHSGETASSILDGFTIDRGSAGPPQSGQGGGGLLSGASPTIRNCIFSRCESAVGSALSCNSGSPVITDCTFVGNGSTLQSISGGAITFRSGSAPTIRRCRFEGNFCCCAGAGGAISSQNSSPLIQDCDFINNGAEVGGAISCQSEAPRIERCRFIDNGAERGGAFYVSPGAPVILDSFFCDNDAQMGTTIMCHGGTLTLTGCTVVRGSWFMGPVAAILSDAGPSQVILHRTIVAFNQGKAAECASGGTIAITCSDVFGNLGDYVDCLAEQSGMNGNFAADPRFCNLDDCNLALDTSSPCLPGQHPAGEPCGLVGAVGARCGVTSVESATWGQIKNQYSHDAR